MLENGLEISRMLTLSTAHITQETSDLLGNNGTTDVIPFSIYDKDQFGWYIYISDDDLLGRFLAIPKDLQDVIRFAYNHKCEVLCLDCDGPETNELPLYEW